METWRKEECAKRPLEIQEIGPGVYMQRKNIKEIHHEAMDGSPAYTAWECECRELTAAEYALYLAKCADAKAEYVAMMSDVELEEEA